MYDGNYYKIQNLIVFVDHSNWTDILILNWGEPV